MSIFLGKWDPFSLNEQPTSFYRGSIHIEEKKFSLQKKRNPLYNSIGWCGKKFVADPFILQRTVFNLAKKNLSDKVTWKNWKISTNENILFLSNV